jgi:gas vesicle protein
MTKENNNQGLYIGAAVVAGILGTLSALMRSSRTIRGWRGQAKDVAQQVLEKGEIMNKKMVLGGVAGGLIGAAAALLLAPKSGAEFIKDFSHPFSDRREKARPASRKPASRKSVSNKKGSLRSAKSGIVRGIKKTEGQKPPKASARKRSTTRRTATAALKQAVTPLEKSITETEAAAT